MVNTSADMVDWLNEGQGRSPVHPNKAQRRRQRLYMTGLLMISFVKFVMNRYPTLHDLSFIVFYVLMSFSLVCRYVEAFYFLVAGVLYAIGNTLFLWITWLKRFSGNANFFYF